MKLPRPCRDHQLPDHFGPSTPRRPGGNLHCTHFHRQSHSRREGLPMTNRPHFGSILSIFKSLSSSTNHTWKAPWEWMQVLSVIASEAPKAQHEPHEPWSRISPIEGQLGQASRESKFSGNSKAPSFVSFFNGRVLCPITVPHRPRRCSGCLQVFKLFKNFFKN